MHGIALDPLRLRAWIEGGDGRPVDEPRTTDRYTRIIQASTRGQKGDRR